MHRAHTITLIENYFLMCHPGPCAKPCAELDSVLFQDLEILCRDATSCVSLISGISVISYVRKGNKDELHK